MVAATVNLLPKIHNQNNVTSMCRIFANAKLIHLQHSFDVCFRNNVNVQRFY